MSDCVMDLLTLDPLPQTAEEDMPQNQDLFHSNPGAGMDLTKLYNMPTPVEQQQQMQHDAFMSRSNPFRPAPPPPSVTSQGTFNYVVIFLAHLHSLAAEQASFSMTNPFANSLSMTFPSPPPDTAVARAPPPTPVEARFDLSSDFVMSKVDND